MLLVLCFIFWLIFNPKTFKAPQYGLIIIFMVIMAISVAANGWLGGSINVINDFYPTVILFFIMASTIDTPQKMRCVFLLLIIASAITALHGVDQTVNGIGWTGTPLIKGRIQYLGIFQDPNDLGILFLISLPMLIYCLTTLHRILVKLVLLGMFGLILYGIYLTNSRGTVLGLVAMLLVGLYRKYSVWKACFLCLLLSPLCLLAPSRMNELQTTETSALGRWDAWYSGFQMLKSNPMLGVGKGNFTEYHELTAHNSFILVLSETGLVGYFVWFSFVALSLYMLYNITVQITKNDEKDNPDIEREHNEIRNIGNTIFASLIGFIFASFFLSRSYNVILYIMCALSVSLYQIAIDFYPNLKKIYFFNNMIPLGSLTIISIIVIYLITKIFIVVL